MSVCSQYGNSLSVYLNKEAMNVLDSNDIIFDQTELKIKIPTLDQIPTHHISKSTRSFAFGTKDGNAKDFAGMYTIEQEEDDFYLTKFN